MTLGYLMNTYPITSTTFVRREIRAHEAAGHPVTRYAIRPWESELVEPEDRAEQVRTTYLLSAGLPALAMDYLRNMLGAPLGALRATAAAARLSAMAGTRRLYPFAYLLEAARLRHLCRDAGITHLHVHFSTNSAAVAMLSFLMGGPGYSFTVHGPDELPDLARNGIRLKTRHARFVAAITGYCRDVVINAAGADLASKIEIVPCGIDVADYAAGGAPPGGSRTLVCVGRLCWQKAQTKLVEALADVVKDHPDVRLVLIGDGDTRPEIERLIRENGLEAHVRLDGWGSNAEVRAALASARALVLPSLAEGLPIVIMEAMAMGRPVISTRIAGIPELLDEACGWILPPGEVAPLADAIRDCLSAPADRLDRLGAEGRRRVLERHDQARTAERLRSLIAARSG